MRIFASKQAPNRRGSERGVRRGQLATVCLLAALVSVARARDWIDADDHRRQNATAEFFRLYRAGELTAPWKDESAGGDYVAYVDNAEAFRGRNFAAVRPPADGKRYYVASVCVRGDPKQPEFLYLLRWEHGRLRLVRAVQLVRGRAQKIAG